MVNDARRFAWRARVLPASHDEFFPPMSLHSDRHTAKKNQHSWISRQRIVAVMAAAVMLFGFAALLQARLSIAAGSTASDGLTAPDGPNSSGAPKSLAMASPASFEQDLVPFLKKYCVDCHGDGTHSGDFSFDRYRNLDALKRDRHRGPRREALED